MCICVLLKSFEWQWTESYKEQNPGRDCDAPPYPFSPLLTPPHPSSLLLIPPHSSSLLLIPPHSSSLLFITPHYSSLLLLSPPPHSFSSSLLLTPPHSSSFLLTPPHSIHPDGSSLHRRGKTWFVKDLLENREQWISPAPQRIIWINGQWQPLYAEIQRIIPGIKFVKGIPANIEDEQFLNPAIRNLIVIDDLMSEASNDKRICDLFSKGLHHRNLSVICLVQNLYYQGKESRTMSLNSKYLVVFNNPRDQQQITVLARQMYLGQSEKFLNTYRMATFKPFGYLLIDLKPDTLNDKHLWPNVFQQTNKLPTAEQPYFYYSEQKGGGSSEEQTEPRSHLNFRNPEPAHPLVDLKTYNRGVPPPHFQFSKEPLNVEDMASIMARASCDECGVLFETLSDLQNHVRCWCYRGSDRKRPRFESESSVDEENDNIAFINMANEVKKEKEERYTAYVEKYQADGFTLKQAKEESELVTL